MLLAYLGGSIGKLVLSQGRSNQERLEELKSFLPKTVEILEGILT